MWSKTGEVPTFWASIETMAGTEKAGLEGEQRITMSETLKKCSLFPPVIFRNMHEKIIFLGNIARKIETKLWMQNNRERKKSAPLLLCI